MALGVRALGLGMEYVVDVLAVLGLDDGARILPALVHGGQVNTIPHHLLNLSSTKTDRHKDSMTDRRNDGKPKIIGKHVKSSFIVGFQFSKYWIYCRGIIQTT